MPKAEIDRAGAAGAAPLPATLQSAGTWTWINLWAAWCVPCKEEIPTLREWERRLAGTETPLRLLFISLDDDERQLRRFLEGEPDGGLRATYWLREGKQRERWLSEADMDVDPELPSHLLIDPKGRVRCVIEGAVEEQDYSRVAEIVAG